MTLLLLLLSCRTGPGAPRGEDTGGPDDTGTPVAPSLDPCQRVRAGEAGPGGIVALSEAHAALRLFGSASDFLTADAGLVAALSGDDPVGAPDLDAYAAAVEDACLLDAEEGALGAATVLDQGGMWWVTPGTGPVSVPDDGAPVVLDLRGLPAVEGLDAVLLAALAASAVGEVALPTHRVRSWSGFVDQWYSSANVYTNSKEDLPGAVVQGARSSGALYVLTEARMAPSTAELAGTVALGGHGFLVGADVLASVAELRWSPVGDRGLAWRGVLLRDADEDTWPDVVPAAVATDDPEAVVATLDPDALSAPERGAVDRDTIRVRDPYAEVPDGTQSVATLRAGLVIAHGTLRFFYPYFDVVGDTIDARLEEVLADTIDPTDRVGHRRRLGRLGQALSDGHMFMGATGGDPLFAGTLNASFAQVDGGPVVTHSAVEGLHRGDRVTAVDGVPIEDLQADWLTWHGGATDGYRHDVANRELWYMLGDQVLTVVDPDGVEEDLVRSPGDPEELGALDFVWYPRENGTLEDLGAPDVAYLNLASEVTTSMDQVDEVLAIAATTAGLVVDMRGYPGVNHYDVLSALCPDGCDSPWFGIPTWTGPDHFEIVSVQYSLSGDEDAYAGRIVLLISPVTVSAAENFCQALVGAGRVEQVIGSASSAGTNGNITGMTLPGGYYLSFTGMQLLNPDGSTFHGIGIPADQVVEPTAADLRDGRDPVLEAAAAVFTGG
ncbi:S41 family peptidase [Myxococcota bacterium]|nr:S41 family peptidase [Myxococcota bacterium]